jgi:hypothetical protein
MSFPNSPEPLTTLDLRGTADLLALVPYILGFHPSQSLCLVGITDSEVICVVRYDLPETDDIEAFTAKLIATVADMPIDAVLLAGYGTDAEVGPALDAALYALAAIEIPVADALRAKKGRYVSYLCRDETCRPPEGTPYEIDTSTVAATAVMRGLRTLPDRALPDRGDLAARITPPPGTSRTAIEAATRAATDIGQQMREPDGTRRLISEVRDTITTALDLYRDGGRLSNETVARLSVLLSMTRLRDEAWVTITPETANSQLALWTDMTRRASINVAACASLLAFTAWLTGDGAHANIAIEQATNDDPDYTMAHLISKILTADLPPTVIADTMPTTKDLATDDPDTCPPLRLI